MKWEGTRASVYAFSVVRVISRITESSWLKDCRLIEVSKNTSTTLFADSCRALVPFDFLEKIFAFEAPPSHLYLATRSTNEK